MEQFFTCTPSFETIAGPSVCTFSCIDGTNTRFVETLNLTIWSKECDDDNANEDDGCSSYCNLNTGWICDNGTNTSPDTCFEICGDGLDFFNYPCDDGNNVDGDGCDSNC